MINKKIIIAVIYILILVGIITGGFFLYKYIKDQIKFTKFDVGLPGQLFGPKTAQKANNLDPVQVLYWTNKYRNDNNLPSLTINNILVKAANTKTQDMFQKQYFEHVSPDGTTPSKLVSTAGYNYKVTGENLALGDFKDEKDLVDAWMASPGHRANILNTDYTEIGIATGLDTFQDRGKTWISVQEFGHPLADCSMPNSNFLNDINAKKSQYDSLISQINTLSAEASNLNNQANQKIQQGNDIYNQTHDKSQAQTYWDEGTALRTQADADIAKAKELQGQSDSLAAEIKTQSDSYNAQVENYNTCIKQ